KLGHVTRFLKEGDKVKVTVMLKGREQSRPDLGLKLAARLAEDAAEFGTVEAAPRQDGRDINMVLAPVKRKTEAKADVAAERDRKAAERQADADAERALQLELREQAKAKQAAKTEKKKKKGPADNIDPDIEL
ncbi:MAG: translation initiation factor IF-3, partial [Propionibacteriaceae bacterium]